MTDKWSLSDLSLMCHMMRSGHSARSVASVFGVSRNVVLGAKWRGENAARDWMDRASVVSSDAAQSIIRRMAEASGFAVVDHLKSEGCSLAAVPGLQRKGLISYALRDGDGKAKALVATIEGRAIGGRNIGDLSMWGMCNA